MTGYRFRDVLAQTGATRSQLIYWTQVGLLRADVEETVGTGHPRTFSWRNLVQARIAVLLAQRGLSVSATTFVLRAVKVSKPGGPAPEVVWIPARATTTHAVWMGSIPEFAAELRRPMAGGGDAGIVIKLQEVIAALAATAIPRA